MALPFVNFIGVECLARQWYLVGIPLDFGIVVEDKPKLLSTQLSGHGYIIAGDMGMHGTCRCYKSVDTSIDTNTKFHD